MKLDFSSIDIITIVSLPYNAISTALRNLNDRNLKMIYKNILFSNLLSIVFGFIVKDYSKSMLYHIGSILLIIYFIYITKSSTHYNTYVDLADDVKKVYNKRFKKITKLKYILKRIYYIN